MWKKKEKNLFVILTFTFFRHAQVRSAHLIRISKNKFSIFAIWSIIDMKKRLNENELE